MEASHGHVQKRALAGNKAVVAKLKCHLALEDEERLLFATMNMRRRTAARWHNGFEGGVLAVCVFAGGKETVHVADNPDPATFTGPSHDCRMIHVWFLCSSKLFGAVVSPHHTLPPSHRGVKRRSYGRRSGIVIRTSVVAFALGFSVPLR